MAFGPIRINMYNCTGTKLVLHFQIIFCQWLVKLSLRFSIFFEIPKKKKKYLKRILSADLYKKGQCIYCPYFTFDNAFESLSITSPTQYYTLIATWRPESVVDPHTDMKVLPVSRGINK